MISAAEKNNVKGYIDGYFEQNDQISWIRINKESKKRR